MRRLVLVIGGADGIDPELLKEARATLAFGVQTWPHALARAMLGGDPPRLERRPSTPGAPSLVVEALSQAPRHELGTSLKDVSFELRAGEILGVAGVSGNGQRELLAALSGEDCRATGRVRLFQQDVTRSDPKHRRQLGLRFVPEERLGRASVPGLSLQKNALLTRPELVSRLGLLRGRALGTLTRRLLGDYDVSARGPEDIASSLS